MRAVGRTVVVSLFAVLLLLIVASPASASAIGASSFGPSVVFQGLKLPMGTYTVNLKGDGLHVREVEAWPYLNTPIGTVCNWNMTVELFDLSGHKYQHTEGAVNNNCYGAANQSPTNTIGVNRDVQSGKMCSTLNQNGTRLTSVCHSIKP